MKLIKKLLFILLLAISVLATDLPVDTVITLIPADSSYGDTRKVDADTLAPILVGHWGYINMKWDISNDSNFVNDTIIIITQYSQQQAGGTWIDIPDLSDTIAPGAADTTSYKRDKVALRDSFGIWLRTINQHIIPIDSAAAVPLAGNTYNSIITNWIDKVDK